jgi:hypothetical protein
MSRQTKAARPKPIVPSAAAFADKYLNIDHWPHQWRVEPRDLAPGQRMLDIFKPFLLHLLSLSQARKTLHRHRDHLGALGGEIIRQLHAEPALRRQPIERVLANSVEEDGGPLIYPRISEAQQRSFDATCRKLYRFLLDSGHPTH